MKKLFCIVGAGEVSLPQLKFPEDAFVIAADGGLAALEQAGIAPDLIMGDFDSLGRTPEGSNVISHSPEKDDTDTMLAVKASLERGAEVIVIYGGLGGRLDHSIANLQTLAYIAAAGACGYLVGCGNVCTVIKNRAIEFDADMQGIISVFSMDTQARGVDIRGLKYCLENQNLSCDFPLGVSNEFAGSPASVSVREGTLAIIWSGSFFEPEKYRII